MKRTLSSICTWWPTQYSSWSFVSPCNMFLANLLYSYAFCHEIWIQYRRSMVPSMKQTLIHPSPCINYSYDGFSTPASTRHSVLAFCFVFLLDIITLWIFSSKKATLVVHTLCPLRAFISFLRAHSKCIFLYTFTATSHSCKLLSYETNRCFQLA